MQFTEEFGDLLDGGVLMAKPGARDRIVLACGECKQRNYDTKKNKLNTTAKLELKKYCRFCRKHTDHTETK
jgi:large subunit ribosomal protein L33